MRHRTSKFALCGLMLALMVCLCAVSASAVTYTNGFGDDGTYQAATYRNGTYEISNAGQLYWFAQLVNSGSTSANARLTADITDNEGTISGDFSYEFTKYRRWVPIGSGSMPYKGTFDGHGHTISGLYYFCGNYSDTGTRGEGGGLFYNNAGTIQNLTIENSYFRHVNAAAPLCVINAGTIQACSVISGARVAGGSGDGGLVVKNEKSGEILNCEIRGGGGDGGVAKENYGTISGCDNYAMASQGGICARNYGIVENCRNYGSLHTAQYSVGGICGYNDGVITDCLNAGEINSQDMQVGGICGNNSGIIERCGNTAEIWANKNYSGGIVGSNQGDALGRNWVKDCYNTGDVWSNAGYCGGIVGGNYALVTGCYSTGQAYVTSQPNTGYICGRNCALPSGYNGTTLYYQTGTVTNCFSKLGYSDSELIGGSDSGAVAKNVLTPRNLYGFPIAYVLNDYQSDKVNWYQNIDNGQPKDEYPVLDSSHGTVYRIGNSAFSNTPPTSDPDEGIIASGNTGYSIQWTLEEDGTLTLTGSSDMPDYQPFGAPWSIWREEIRRVVMEGSITGVGNYAFWNCSNLTTIKLCDDVGTIGERAFADCTSLQFVFMGTKYTGGNTTIGKYAFGGCTALEWVAFPALTKVDNGAFDGCTSLDSIYFSTYNAYLQPTFGLRSFGGVKATLYCPQNANLYYSVLSSEHGGTIQDESVAEGPCGFDTWWNFDAASGKLTISGSGAIAEYLSGSYVPWSGVYGSITSVVVEEGITVLPRYTFEYAEKAKNITLPSTLTKMAFNAFNDCRALNNLLIPASVTEVTSGNFNRCDVLTDVYYLGTEAEWTQIPNAVDGIKSSFNTNKITMHYLTQSGKEPTCTEKGIETYYSFPKPTVYTSLYDIDKQEISKPRELPATGHTSVKIPAVAASCTATGLTEGAYCSVCDATLTPQNVIPMLAHSLKVTEKVAATCTSDGHETKTCQNCPYSETTTHTKLGHSYRATVTAPTCTEKGYTTHTCSRCKDTVKDTYVNATGHSFGNWTQTKAPTCTAKGAEKRTCTKCGHAETREAAALGHSYQHEITAPTCTEKGYTTHTCSRCKDTVKDTYVNATGHSFGNWTQTKAPTCIAKGTEKRTCAKCGHAETRELAALGHKYTDKVTAPTCTAKGYTTHTCSTCGSAYVDTYVNAKGHTEVKVPGKAATCTAAGLTDGAKCSVCGVVTTPQQTIAAKGHTNVTVPGKAATCTASGLTDGAKCSVCGTVTKKQETIAAKGHTNVTVPGKAATCTAPGLTDGAKCSVCGTVTKKQETIAAKGHTNVTIPGKAATCTAPGLTDGAKCSVCGTVTKKQETIAAEGHTAVTVPGKAATCTATGLTDGAKCSVCGVETKKQETIAATGHSWSEWKQTKAPTESAEGEKARTCSRCKATETESIPKLSHTHSYTSTVTAPTCTEKGYTTHTCKCGHSYMDTYVNAKGHTAVTVPGKVATCTATGLTDGAKCSVCGVETKKQETIAALGHSWGEWKQTKAPTESAEGEKTRTCSRCKAAETESIPKLSHTHSYTSTVTAPTCTEKGYTTHTCKCGHSYVDAYVNAKGHTAVTVSGKAATCTATGLTDGAKCSICGVETKKQETIAALGHSWSEWKQTKAPTEDAEGEKTRTCSRCKATETESIPKLSHTHSYTSVVTAPTCTEKGYTTHICKCGHSYVDAYVNAKGHTAVTVPGKAATCTTTGLTDGAKCSVCGVETKKQETIPATGHSWGEWKQTKAPTEDAEGEKTRTCSRCKATETESIPKLNHTHSYTSTVTAPTCTEKGYTIHTCKCGHSYVDTYVNAKGHTEVKVPGKAATCTATGLTDGAKCSVCGVETKKQETIPATGHSFGAWEQTKAPDIGVKGEEQRKCTKCGHTEKREISAEAPSFKVVLNGNKLEINLPDRPDNLWIYAASYDASGRIVELRIVEANTDQTVIFFGNLARAETVKAFFLDDVLMPLLDAVEIPVS